MTVYDRKRREPRVRLRTIVEITGRAADGSMFSEQTVTLDISTAGARIALRRRVAFGSLLTYTACTYAFQAIAVVQSIAATTDPHASAVGLEFLDGGKNPLAIWSSVGRTDGRA